MRKVNTLICAGLLILQMPYILSAQNKIGIDIAAVSNRHSNMNGLNISGFYHFSERFAAGIEMNRFFPVNRSTMDEELQVSAWDFDYNFHYIIPISRELKLYPLTGFSHTSEKEMNIKTNEVTIDRFWSYNTGVGLLWEGKKWSPHIEYSFTWGPINQQFLIAGLSYELSLGSKKKE